MLNQVSLVLRLSVIRMREVRIGIKRFEKLMDTISGVESALRILISEIFSLESFILILGASPI